MKLRISNVRVTEGPKRPAAWAFRQKVVKGTEMRYEVCDDNYSSCKKWEFLVSVPNDKKNYIEVRPIKVPNIKRLAQSQKLTIAFRRATLPPNIGNYYCKVTVADPSGYAKKISVSRKGWHALPWKSELEGRIREKAEVRAGKGGDGNALVVLIDKDDYEMMIKVFFVLKVWVLRQNFNIYFYNYESPIH